jgi:hypothetical protein
MKRSITSAGWTVADSFERNEPMRTILTCTVAVVLTATLQAAEDVTNVSAVPINLSFKSCGEGWREWEGIANVEGAVAWREHITALSVGPSGDLWVGTSHGRLLSMAKERWTLEAHLARIQITGLAFDGPERVWLSTSDGIRRLDKKEKTWNVKVFRTYYQGEPAFASGAYIPGEDAERLWGYVDGIYIPSRVKTYAPFAVSTEHGLFCWQSFYCIWHNFLAHYWGANSPWLDTGELLPNRRPTCMVEDTQENLWIGTGRDGIVRVNARSRRYHSRPPENNKKDGTEFTRIGSKEVGWEFDKVVDLTSGLERGIWAVLESKEKGRVLARFDGSSWATMPLPDNRVANCVAEIKLGAVFIGLADDHRQSDGLIEVDWKSRKLNKVSGPRPTIRRIVQTPEGRVFAASWFGLYEKPSKP